MPVVYCTTIALSIYLLPTQLDADLVAFVFCTSLIRRKSNEKPGYERNDQGRHQNLGIALHNPALFWADVPDLDPGHKKFAVAKRRVAALGPAQRRFQDPAPLCS